ncbi:hypothetical protein DL95DRAFT_489102 [Leptodontidium sp. 2 PMI_412]|nr:hypothetical protein DL95DRAFT_489102 [Leptodontidium sp. 2 PMI_412]
MSQYLWLGASIIFTLVIAQVPGTLTPEEHPKLITQKCTKDGGCIPVDTAIVLDASYRYIHEVGGYTPCASGAFNSTICPTVEVCAKNCEVEGADYSTYGIKTAGDALTLNLFTTKEGILGESSPRVYLMADDSTYDMLKLLNQELAFDVDMSKVPCGINGALYLSEMPNNGGLNGLNKVGAKYGSGYCDAQCPKQAFINGMANIDQSFGACCNEMDIWEANSAAAAYPPHSCNITGVYACTGDLCGSKGVCDQSGCDFNSYRLGAREFYGPGKTIDTTKKFTVVTQFLTDDGSSAGKLQTISRIYIQNGAVIGNSNVNVPGVDPVSSIDDSYCTSQVKAFGGSGTFEKLGGMAGLGSALSRGMVLIFSIWMDAGSGMLWLDGEYPLDANATKPGVARGPCAADSGNTTMLANLYPDAQVKWSNIKVGDIGSTFGGLKAF